MGREATCTCVWNGKKISVKALIEPPELILRGGIRRRLPIAKMQSIKSERTELRFVIDGEPVALTLGKEMAAKWAEVLLKPPPSLAMKMGITSDTTVWMIGPVDDPALRAALAEAKSVSRRMGDLILARVDTSADLHSALMRAADQLRDGTPVWFIYRKGPGHPLNENLVRATALATGIVDNKVASVSAIFSALRFVKRRSLRFPLSAWPLDPCCYHRRGPSARKYRAGATLELHENWHYRSAPGGQDVAIQDPHQGKARGQRLFQSAGSAHRRRQGS